MKALHERGVIVVLATVAACFSVRASGEGPPPSEGGETQGLRKLEMTSYYEARPISVNPNAPSYSFPIQFSDIANAHLSEWVLRLDDNARQAIENNGFVVVDGLAGEERYDDMVKPYGDLKEAGVPNFVTSDSLLHLYHVQFDEILRCIEEREFFFDLISMSEALFEESVNQYEGFSGDLKEAAKRNVAYFAVALKLLGSEVNVPNFVSAPVQSELGKIEAHSGFLESDVFIYKEDYSQYVPRGHYTRSETLKKYFKAMMWYGRMAFLLKGAIPWGPLCEAVISPDDARIQTVQASLIALALDRLEGEGKPIADIWNRMYAVTSFFVGTADDLTPYEYKEAILSIFGSPVNVEDFNDDEKMLSLKTALALMRSPQIYGGTGEIYIVLPPPPWPEPPLTPEQLDEVLDKSKGMRLMGQRFIPDSYMFQQLVAPVTGRYVGSEEPFTAVYIEDLGYVRGFPRGLDVMAVLGSDEALAILEREGDAEYEFWDKAMGDMVELFDSFTEEDWNKNLYWSWMYTLKSLLGSYGEGYPAFTQGTRWKHKQLHTALASWAELRHDTILYAKQSYTPGIYVTTSVPPEPPKPDRGYVEPVPEFYNRLVGMTRMTRTGLTDLNVLDAAQEYRLKGLEDVLSRLTDISISELEGRELSEEDYDYIENFGWTLAPLIEGLSDDKGAKTAMIADVHTDINSKKVLEEGVGYVKLMVVAYKVPDGRTLLGAGPVFSYYEFKWPMGDRLTDEKWTAMLESGTNPAQPDWVSSFMHPVDSSPVGGTEDSDGDRLLDSWEKSIWGGIDVVNDPNGDYDEDGFTNEQEYMLGTNPADAASCFRVLEIQQWGSGTYLYWNTPPGNKYQILYSDDLRTWQEWGTPISPRYENTDVVVPGTGDFRQRFFRVNLVP
ncbi:MAG: DUF3160 domain-containing protein [bacterium]|nr:DUF3160 domain-containing protein [bacterium]